eukprot:CAMPEP_0184259464 /NCGR_PEP_ID=MMETSP0977-20130417/11709_1 /TAXON_ID=483370 /ORGANISM="non described non described, Strain CCMP2097" /LENGTH=45 /DNA_ID= /DNA_START= /DNA_END= /DNA_ORIENTATION=
MNDLHYLESARADAARAACAEMQMPPRTGSVADTATLVAHKASLV